LFSPPCNHLFAHSTFFVSITYMPFLSIVIFFLLTRRRPRSTLFPYTTLFRSWAWRILTPTLYISWRLFDWAMLRKLSHTGVWVIDRKSTRLNSSHVAISYAVFCLKKKNLSVYTPMKPRTPVSTLYSAVVGAPP